MKHLKSEVKRAEEWAATIAQNWFIATTNYIGSWPPPAGVVIGRDRYEEYMRDVVKYGGGRTHTTEYIRESVRRFDTCQLASYLRQSRQADRKVARILKLRKQGKSKRFIARKLGINPRSVNQLPATRKLDGYGTSQRTRTLLVRMGRLDNDKPRTKAQYYANKKKGGRHEG